METTICGLQYLTKEYSTSATIEAASTFHFHEVVSTPGWKNAKNMRKLCCSIGICRDSICIHSSIPLNPNPKAPCSYMVYTWALKWSYGNHSGP